MGLTYDEADDVLLHLIQSNFLNEYRFAQAFSKGKFKIKQWGRKKIVYQLKGKGINEKLIQNALGNIDEEEYVQTARKLMQKKWNLLGNDSIEQKTAKVFRFMQQKGYESALISEEIKILKKQLK